MIILIKLFLNSKLDMIQTDKFVKQQFGIQKGGKVLLWNQVKSRMEACYSELVLEKIITGHEPFKLVKVMLLVCSLCHSFYCCHLYCCH